MTDDLLHRTCTLRSAPTSRRGLITLVVAAPASLAVVEACVRAYVDGARASDVACFGAHGAAERLVPAEPVPLQIHVHLLGTPLVLNDLVVASRWIFFAREGTSVLELDGAVRIIERCHGIHAGADAADCLPVFGAIAGRGAHVYAGAVHNGLWVASVPISARCNATPGDVCPPIPSFTSDGVVVAAAVRIGFAVLEARRRIVNLGWIAPRFEKALLPGLVLGGIICGRHPAVARLPDHVVLDPAVFIRRYIRVRVRLGLGLGRDMYDFIHRCVCVYARVRVCRVSVSVYACVSRTGNVIAGRLTLFQRLYV